MSPKNSQKTTFWTTGQKNCLLYLGVKNGFSEPPPPLIWLKINSVLNFLNSACTQGEIYAMYRMVDTEWLVYLTRIPFIRFSGSWSENQVKNYIKNTVFQMPPWKLKGKKIVKIILKYWTLEKNFGIHIFNCNRSEKSK